MRQLFSRDPMKPVKKKETVLVSTETDDAHSYADCPG